MSHQEVPEEPCLIEITEPYHVIHTLHRGGVHGVDGALRLLVDLVLLYVMKDLTLYRELTLISPDVKNANSYGVLYLSFIIDQLKLSGVCHLDLRPDRHLATGVHPHKIPLIGETRSCDEKCSAEKA